MKSWCSSIFPTTAISLWPRAAARSTASELTAALINQKDSLVEGIRYAQEIIQGSSTILLLTQDGIIAARDKLGRLPCW